MIYIDISIERKVFVVVGAENYRTAMVGRESRRRVNLYVSSKEYALFIAAFYDDVDAACGDAVVIIQSVFDAASQTVDFDSVFLSVVIDVDVLNRNILELRFIYYQYGLAFKRLKVFKVGIHLYLISARIDKFKLVKAIDCTRTVLISYLNTRVCAQTSHFRQIYFAVIVELIFCASKIDIFKSRIGYRHIDYQFAFIIIIVAYVLQLISVSAYSAVPAFFGSLVFWHLGIRSVLIVVYLYVSFCLVSRIPKQIIA